MDEVPFWLLTIHDFVTGANYTRTLSTHTSSMRAAFWMYEVHRYWDQLGAQDPGRATMDNLQYKRADLGTAWVLVTGDSGSCGLTPPGPFQSWHHCARGNYGAVEGYESYVKSWTTTH